MFRIRRVSDDLYPMNRYAVKQVKEIMCSQFSEVKEEKIQAITEQLHNPLKYRYRPSLFVADNNNGKVKAFGVDTAKGDPTGSFGFTSKDFEKNGRMIGSLRIPTLVVQEGGYLSRTLGTNAQHFIKGLHDTVWK